MEVIFKGDLLVMKIKITYLILSPLVICYFGPILIFDLDHFFGDLPYLWSKAGVGSKSKDGKEEEDTRYLAEGGNIWIPPDVRSLCSHLLPHWLYVNVAYASKLVLRVCKITIKLD